MVYKSLLLGLSLYLTRCSSYEYMPPSTIESRTLEAAIPESAIATRQQELSLRSAFDLHYMEGKFGSNRHWEIL